MVDYSALKKKFPAKDPQKKKKLAAIKAIKREYAAKRAALGGGAPNLKKGVVFYAVVILGLMILGSLVLSVAGKGGPKEISRAQILVRKSIDSVAVALGRYRYHVGSYPSTEEGLEALAAITPRKKGWNGPYVNHVVKDPWGHDYVYVTTPAMMPSQRRLFSGPSPMAEPTISPSHPKRASSQSMGYWPMAKVQKKVTNITTRKTG